MNARHDSRRELPVENQIMLIHHDLDEIDGVIEKKLETLEAKMDRITVVFITGMISLIVALVAALTTALSLG